ncbi:class I SAM-dependent methyltransferase [Halobacillus litoralis]|uniref:class I SAM-dependent methyltransferase n=1 Tax=Halobacillus litoralis TaxID=45668 RepID=UPI001CFDCC6E|nr:class I SAM-dependent methyltransferase [Halobacillus litoralis]
MGYRGASVYDQGDFFSRYMARRHRKESPNNAMEKPVIMESLGDIKGAHILDLGCGDAAWASELYEKGCVFYEGVEGSENMVEAAWKEVSPFNAVIHHASLEELDFREASYDFIVSRMVLHYIEELDAVLQNIHEALKVGGRLIFSVQHPVLTSSTESAFQTGRRTNWIVDDYFHQGERREPWMDKEVIKYHRTLEEYFKLLLKAGFRIHDLREGEPGKENFDSDEELKRRQRIPLFLIFSCEKI